MNRQPSRQNPIDRAVSTSMTASTPLRWTSHVLDELSPVQVYKILQLRCEVFIVGQNSVVLEVDGRDLEPGCTHVMGWNDAGELMAYARVFGPSGALDAPVVGRVVTHPKVRGQGAGKALMEAAIGVCDAKYPGKGCQLGAQAYLETFYGRLGFTRIADAAPYAHHGIDHLDMFRPST
ncbi:Aste57867_2924 [Aphanomyces stellatus]|uniref:Aste57867_2924 protein n=1 Tax=Aphanomyces stellatus TaxID=120398 RepID=A0A485KEA2_9STRA|nr:hypothetical protein As57867_002916 [Aphanomyces stellatus]VFT80107.1 Aste57867_2924 [Aphanomyces stellatus]